MEKRDISIIISGIFFILFLLFVLFRPDLNLEKISGKTIGESVLPRDKLVLRYDFEEGSGNNINDLTGKGHTGTLTGTTLQFVSGRSGVSGDYSLYFPGGSNYLTLQSADDIKGGQDVSVSMWVKVGGSMPSLVYKGDNIGNIIDYNLSYGLISATQKGFSCEIKNVNLKTLVVSDPISDENSWYDVVCVLDKTGANLKLYVNGVSKTVVVSDPLTFSSTTNPVYIGIDSVGRLDSFRIYNKALSDSEAANLYSTSIPVIGPGPTNGLIALWTLNEGSGNKANELINIYDGTITGAAWMTDTKPGGTSEENVLNFDGSDDYISVPGFDISANPPDKLTFAFWSKNNVGSGTFISDSRQNAVNGFIWLFRAGNSLAFQNANGATAVTLYFYNFFNAAQEDWHHVAVTVDYNTGEVKTYKNGIFFQSQTIPGMVKPNSNKLYIGAFSPTHSSKLKGIIYDARIYNRVLTDSEMKSFNPNYVPSPKFPYGGVDLTGSLNDISNTLTNGIKGNISFVISNSGKKIDNNSYINLTLSKIGFESSSKVYIDQIMNRLNIAGTSYSSDNYDLGGYSYAIGYSGGTYSVDSSIFGLNSLSGSGSYNLSLTFIVTNGNKYSKSKIVTRANSAPVLKAVIPNLTWAKNTNNFMDLSNYFSDPDNDNLTYSTVGTTGSIIISISGSKANFTQPSNYTGSVYMRFRANDLYNATESNLIVLNVSGIFIGNQTCIPAWQSGNWSECSVDGLQIRTIVDVNNCNVDTGKPADNQSCVYAPVSGGDEGVPTQGESTTGQPTLKEKPTKKEEKSIFSNKVFLSGLILLIFAGVIVGVYFIRKQRGLGVAEEVAEKPEFKEKPVGVQKVEVQKFKPVYEEAQNVKEMKDYINNALNQGADMNSIKENLIKAGWNKDDVNNTSNFITVERFAKSRISTMSKDQIKNLLISKGWNKELVEKVLAGL